MKITIAILISVPIPILFIYLMSNRFRINRASRLSDSLAFQELTQMGFASKTIKTSKVFTGNYMNHNFLIYIDPMDSYFRNDFSIVFVTSYEKINVDILKHLNDKYKSRLKSVFLNSELFLFYDSHAQFRCSISPIRISSGELKFKLDKIAKILNEENLKARSIENPDVCMTRPY